MTPFEKQSIVISQLRDDRDYLEISIKHLIEDYKDTLGDNYNDFHEGYDAALKEVIKDLTKILDR